MIQKGHLKKYVKGDSSRGPKKSSSHERDDAGNLVPSKEKETLQGKVNNYVRNTLNTIAEGFVGGEETSFCWCKP